MTLINMDCLDRGNLFSSLFFVQKRNCPEGQPLWRIVLNPKQVGCNPAAVFELYPVVAVSSAVDAFAICVADVAFVHVVPFAIIRARSTPDISAGIVLYISFLSANYLFKLVFI